jgi:hypothetical protein
MTTTHTAPARRVRRSARVAYPASRVLLAGFGLFGLAAVSYFSFLAAPGEGGLTSALDAVVAGWKAAVCLAFLVAALAPGLSRSARLGTARFALSADLAFDLVKIVHYHEAGAPGFVAVDIALLTLVLLAGTDRGSR